MGKGVLCLYVAPDGRRMVEGEGKGFVAFDARSGEDGKKAVSRIIVENQIGSVMPASRSVRMP